MHKTNEQMNRRTKSLKLFRFDLGQIQGLFLYDISKLPAPGYLPNFTDNS